MVLMQDGFHREISYLRLSVTDRCNYRCRYCMPPSGVALRGHGEICSFEELYRMAEAAVRLGVRKIRVTGGEPLVRRGIVDFCARLAALDGLEQLCMTTNGALLRAYAKPLRDAGVTRLNISVDTLREERYHAITRCGRLQDALDGIAAAQAAGFTQIRLNCVLQGGINDDEIEDFVALSRDNPWQIRFIELMPMGECADWDKSCFLPADTVTERCPALQLVSTDGVARCYQLPGALGTVGLITPMSHLFCSACNRIRVTADGKLKPCLHSEREIPLRGLSGAALTEAIRSGIAEKPPQHRMCAEGSSAALRNMHAIGG